MDDGAPTPGLFLSQILRPSSNETNSIECVSTSPPRSDELKQTPKVDC